jgi:hypothetical protein
MGFFFSNLNLFKEAEVDGQEVGDPNQQSTDYTDDGQDQQPPEQNPTDYTEDQPTEQDDQNTEETGDDAPPPEDMGGDGETTDYTEEGGGEEGEGDNNAPPPETESDQPVDDIKKQEEELYGNLTPDQLDIKHKELKTQFLAMYDMTTTIIERIGDAAISEENIGIAEYISDNLSRLRDMLVDYMNNVYQGKSYIENSINYNRFLAVLNGINKILEEVDKKQNN